MTLGDFCKWFKRSSTTREEVATILEKLLHGYEDQSLLSVLEYMGDDPLINAVCVKLNEIERDYPSPEGSKNYCNTDGMRLIEELVTKLRSEGNQ